MFDGEYDFANKSYFYTVDSNYTFKNVKDSLNVMLMLYYVVFNEKEKGFDDSQRNIVGVAWGYKIDQALYGQPVEITRTNREPVVIISKATYETYKKADFFNCFTEDTK